MNVSHIMRYVLLGFLLAVRVPHVLGQDADRTNVEHLNGSGILPAEPALPFSEAVRVGDVVFLSGMVGLRPGTLELVAGGTAAEAQQTMENIGAVLNANGYALSDIVKCTVMMEDIAEWSVFNEVYQSFFTAPYPARSAFGADGLALGARVEVECIAAVPEQMEPEGE
jgi:2-iminobutanoate/2-iminopropanoate deaminase